MPKLNVSVPHALSQQEAMERLNRFVDLLRDNYQEHVSGLEQSWEDSTLRFQCKTYGIPVQGKITVTDHELNVNGELPFPDMAIQHEPPDVFHHIVRVSLGGLAGIEDGDDVRMTKLGDDLHFPPEAPARRQAILIGVDGIQGGHG